MGNPKCYEFVMREVVSEDNWRVIEKIRSSVSKKTMVGTFQFYEGLKAQSREFAKGEIFTEDLH
jgi:hypothetical protein